MSKTQTTSEVDVIIGEVKDEFRRFSARRGDLVRKLGNAYEKVVANPESICEEIKNVLRDEIAQGLISRRDIERYCPDTWKRKTKPKNDKLSFSITEDGAINNTNQEKNKVLIDTTGRAISEPQSPRSKADPESSTIFDSDNEVSDPQIHEGRVVGECSQCKKYERQILELMNERKLPDHVDFEFSMSFDDLHLHMQSIFKESGVNGSIWFHGTLDTRTGRIVDVSLGHAVSSISEENGEGAL